MKAVPLGSQASARLQGSISLRGIFGSLLVLHSRAAPAERAILEPVIYSKAINYRRDVKRNKIHPDDRARIDVLLAEYQASAAPILRKRMK